ncbi:MAG TPA: hypothetical protein VMW38_15405 [Terriglobia bacterium]|nr:hypothetical protein [Terriglobia bacterium]
MEKAQKTLTVIEIHEDKASGHQWFQIHEEDPQYKIDRIVYRERSREGWFKEISPDDYLRKVNALRQKTSQELNQAS